MADWQRHLQSFMWQVSKRYLYSHSASFSTFYQSKASLVPAEVTYLSSRRDSYRPAISRPLHCYLQKLRFTGTRSLLTDASDTTPISSPLIPALHSSTGNTETQKDICKTSRVQAVLKGIKQSPKKVNLFAEMVNGMRVEDALFQLQVTVKRAAKTFFFYKPSKFKQSDFSVQWTQWGSYIQLVPMQLTIIVLMLTIFLLAFTGNGFYKKRISYHSKDRYQSVD